MKKNKSKVYLEQFNWFLCLAEKFKDDCVNYNGLRCRAEGVTCSILNDDSSDYKKVLQLKAIWECVEYISDNDLLEFWQSEIKKED